MVEGVSQKLFYYDLPKKDEEMIQDSLSAVDVPSMEDGLHPLPLPVVMNTTYSPAMTTRSPKLDQRGEAKSGSEEDKESDPPPPPVPPLHLLQSKSSEFFDFLIKQPALRPSGMDFTSHYVVIGPRFERALRFVVFMIPALFFGYYGDSWLNVNMCYMIPLIYTILSALLPPKITSIALIVFLGFPAGVVAAGMISLMWYLGMLPEDPTARANVMYGCLLVLVLLHVRMKTGALGQLMQIPMLAILYGGGAMAFFYLYAFIRDGVQVDRTREELEQLKTDLEEQYAGNRVVLGMIAAAFALLFTLMESVPPGEVKSKIVSVPKIATIYSPDLQYLVGQPINITYSNEEVGAAMEAGQYLITIAWKANDKLSVIQSILINGWIAIGLYIASLICPPPRFVRSFLRSELVSIALWLRTITSRCGVRLHVYEDQARDVSLEAKQTKLAEVRSGIPKNCFERWSARRHQRRERLRAGMKEGIPAPLIPTAFKDEAALDNFQDALLLTIASLSDLRAVAITSTFEPSVRQPGLFCFHGPQFLRIICVMSELLGQQYNLLMFENVIETHHRRQSLEEGCSTEDKMIHRRGTFPSPKGSVVAVEGSPEMQRTSTIPLRHKMSELDCSRTLNFRTLFNAKEADVRAVCDAALEVIDRVALCIAMKPVYSGSSVYSYTANVNLLKDAVKQLEAPAINLRRSLRRQLREYHVSGWFETLAVNAMTQEFNAVMISGPHSLGMETLRLLSAQSQPRPINFFVNIAAFIGPMFLLPLTYFQLLKSLLCPWTWTWCRAPHTVDGMKARRDKHIKKALQRGKIKWATCGCQGRWWNDYNVRFCVRSFLGFALLFALPVYWDSYRMWYFVSTPKGENRDILKLVASKVTSWAILGYITTILLSFNGTFKRGLLRLLGVVVGTFFGWVCLSLWPRNVAAQMVFICVTIFFAIYVTTNPKSPLLGFHPSWGYAAQLFTYQEVIIVVEAYQEIQTREEIVVARLVGQLIGIATAIVTSAVIMPVRANREARRIVAHSVHNLTETAALLVNATTRVLLAALENRSTQYAAIDEADLWLQYAKLNMNNTNDVLAKLSLILKDADLFSESRIFPLKKEWKKQLLLLTSVREQLRSFTTALEAALDQIRTEGYTARGISQRSKTHIVGLMDDLADNVRNIGLRIEVFCDHRLLPGMGSLKKLHKKDEECVVAINELKMQLRREGHLHVVEMMAKSELAMEETSKNANEVSSWNTQATDDHRGHPPKTKPPRCCPQGFQLTQKETREEILLRRRIQIAIFPPMTALYMLAIHNVIRIAKDFEEMKNLLTEERKFDSSDMPAANAASMTDLEAQLVEVRSTADKPQPRKENGITVARSTNERGEVKGENLNDTGDDNGAHLEESSHSSKQQDGTSEQEHIATSDSEDL